MKKQNIITKKLNSIQNDEFQLLSPLYSKYCTFKFSEICFTDETNKINYQVNLLGKKYLETQLNRLVGLNKYSKSVKGIATKNIKIKI
jgi:hypothetical protein